MAATVTKTPTGQLKFRSLGLDTPKPKDESEWGTFEVTVTQEEATSRPHHKPILTEAMRKENEGGRWGRVIFPANSQSVDYADCSFRARERPTSSFPSTPEELLAWRPEVGELWTHDILAGCPSPTSEQDKAAMPVHSPPFHSYHLGDMPSRATQLHSETYFPLSFPFFLVTFFWSSLISIQHKNKKVRHTVPFRLPLEGEEHFAEPVFGASLPEQTVS